MSTAFPDYILGRSHQRCRPDHNQGSHKDILWLPSLVVQALDAQRRPWGVYVLAVENLAATVAGRVEFVISQLAAT
jgi:hypothetical protein